jgi:hypothetical protein
MFIGVPIRTGLNLNKLCKTYYDTPVIAAYFRVNESIIVFVVIIFKSSLKVFKG